MNQQMTIDDAIHKGQMAAMAASLKADELSPDWSTGAALLFVQFASDVAKGEPFLMEDAREWAERGGWPSPPDRRAWGHVVKAMKVAGRVVSCGFGRARTSNGSPKVLWKLA
jgi:hypothetical protein